VDITYRRVGPDDAGSLVAFLTADTWPFHGSSVVTADMARRWIADGRYDSDDSRAFWITADGADAGLIRLMDMRDSTPVFDLRLRGQWRGQGIGGQALRWLTAYLFNELPAIRRVEGHTRQDNRAMRRTFERAGYVKEAHHREAWPVDGGEFHDAVGYAILRRDWLAGTATAVDWHDEHVLAGTPPASAPQPARSSPVPDPE
jgi:RimJ/RimL family protein N-acetyltransferase